MLQQSNLCSISKLDMLRIANKYRISCAIELFSTTVINCWGEVGIYYWHTQKVISDTI